MALLLGGCPKSETTAPQKPAPAPVDKAPAAEVPAPEEDPDARFAEALTGHRALTYEADLDEIKKRQVLRVITRNNSTSYFLYRGTEAGFHYELAKLFADELGVRLEIVVPRANRDVIPWLLEGRGDIVIAGLPDDAPRVDRVAVTRPYLESPLVVVTRKGRVPAIADIKDLGQATITLRPSSSAMKRMRDLASENPDVGINLRAAKETLEPEDVLDLVASGEVDATVVAKRLVDVELLHRDDLEIALTLPGETVKAVFATRPDDVKLLAAADAFLKKHHRGTVFNILYNRYHKNARRAEEVRSEDLRIDKGGGISPWDDAFKEGAQGAGLDWRLLAAQAYQESRFNPNAKSNFGAQGLMQIMPRTAREVGVKDPFDPLDSIKGGAKYMAWLMSRYDKPDMKLKDRVRFALAAYNVGPGHLDDARKLAEKEGLDDGRWFGHVERALRLLSKPRYYRDAKYGYCRGEEPVQYVSQIQSRYDNYVAMTDENAGKPVAVESSSP